MENLNIEANQFNNKVKNYGDNMRKHIYNLKKQNKDKSKVICDRGDSDPFKNSKEKIDTKNNMNSTTKVIPVNEAEKRDAYIHDNKRKRDRDNFNKAKNIIDKRCDTKSKNILELKDEVNKDRWKARDIEAKNKQETSKSSIKIDKTPNTIHKRPSIKTITDTDTTKTYKSVTFTEQKQQKTIEIKLPSFGNVKQTKIPKLINKLRKIENRNNTEDKLTNKRNKLEKKNKHKRDVTSPIRNQDGGSPPTEIAKWAPNISEHTKPYYEAWINTTLAAMSNKKDKLFFEQQKVFKTFQKALEQRSKSPELIYENFTDERFIGKIKINHR